MINFAKLLSFDKFNIGSISGTIQQRPKAHGPLRDKPSSEDERSSSKDEESSSEDEKPSSRDEEQSSEDEEPSSKRPKTDGETSQSTQNIGMPL